MELVEYGVSGRGNFIFLLKEMEGWGWKLVVALREIRCSLEVRGNVGHNKGRLGFNLMEDIFRGRRLALGLAMEVNKGTNFHTRRH